jgi:uncharacterized protein (TIGR00730 family)
MSATIRSLCVFCGSTAGRRDDYSTAARNLGRLLAERGIRLIYGGGNIGLMGILADEVLRGGGQVIGVIPRHLVERELAHAGATEMRIVSCMHERKALMAELADAFVALPGGIGTFEELLEIMTWAQLGLHNKPIGLLDVCGYYRPLLALLQNAAHEGFLQPENQGLLTVATDPAELLDQLAASISQFRFQISDLKSRI